jgi:hypothetical protein
VRSIQAAVDASDQDDRVLVCPGVYKRVNIVGRSHDGLILRAVGHRVSIRGGRVADEMASVRARDVRRLRIHGLHILAGLTRDGGGSKQVGILLSRVTGRISGNAFVTPRSSESQCPLAYGIRVFSGRAAGTLRITHNMLRSFEVTGIQVFGAQGICRRWSRITGWSFSANLSVTATAIAP